VGNKKEVAQYLYIGETCRSAYERGVEHMDDIRQLKPTSHLLKHLVDQHENEDFDFINIRMEIINFSRTAYERQIMEAVQIQHHRHHNLLNSRAEFNRSAIPRLGLKLGDKEYTDKSKEEKDEKEETLISKIRELRKKRNKERGSRRGEPKRKKMRVDPTEEEFPEINSPQERTNSPLKNIHEPGKRKGENVSGQKMKQRRIEIYIEKEIIPPQEEKKRKHK
jgi:hypothetical protein